MSHKNVHLAATPRDWDQPCLISWPVNDRIECALSRFVEGTNWEEQNSYLDLDELKNVLTGTSGSSTMAKLSLILGTPAKERYYHSKVNPWEYYQDIKRAEAYDTSGSEEKSRVCSSLRENFWMNLLQSTSTEWVRKQPRSSQNKVGGQEATDTDCNMGNWDLRYKWKNTQSGWLNTRMHLSEGKKLRIFLDESWISML